MVCLDQGLRERPHLLLQKLNGQGLSAREGPGSGAGQLRQSGISRNKPYAPSAEDGQHVKKV
jgi:hypothetical protein